MENPKYIKALAKQINKIRIQKELTFEEMGLRCEIDRHQTYKICKEGINITAITILKLSKGLEVPIAEIFNFKY